MSVHENFQPIQSSRLAGYRQHIYIYDVLFYYLDVSKLLQVKLAMMSFYVYILRRISSLAAVGYQFCKLFNLSKQVDIRIQYVDKSMLIIFLVLINF